MQGYSVNEIVCDGKATVIDCSYYFRKFFSFVNGKRRIFYFLSTYNRTLVKLTLLMFCSLSQTYGLTTPSEKEPQLPPSSGETGKLHLAICLEGVILHFALCILHLIVDIGDILLYNIMENTVSRHSLNTKQQEM